MTNDELDDKEEWLDALKQLEQESALGKRKRSVPIEKDSKRQRRTK